MKHALPLFFLAAAACTDHLPLVGAPCPCAEGTRCERTTNTCVVGAESLDDAAASPDLAMVPDGGWLDDGFPDGLGPPDPGVPPARPTPPPEACQRLGFHTQADYESGFIVPRCGSSGCHQAIFPPRNMNRVDLLRENLVNVKALSLCKTDFYINRANPKLSFMLTKVVNPNDEVPCPSDLPNGTRNGGTRMPNSQPAIAGPRLTGDETSCYIWWIYELAK
jgi:hypothetical protein